MTQQQNQSEIARLLRRIDAEYAAARQALHGPATGTARHDFIIARKEQIARAVETLTAVVGEEEAIHLLIEHQAKTRGAFLFEEKEE